MFDFFYSDPHFGHEAVIGYSGRPFGSAVEMDEELVRRYNARVGPDHVVCWVGDCFFHRLDRACEIMEELNGRKVLVKGNHDRSNTWMLKVGFDVVVDRLYVRMAGRNVLVCHYPYAHARRRSGQPDLRYPERRPKPQKGEALIHGHTHSEIRCQGSMIHVGVDAWDYAPASIDDVWRLVELIGPVSSVQ